MAVKLLLNDLFLMDEPESYIERIQRLASQNRELKEQLDEMVKRFNNLDEVNQHFQSSLVKYSSEDEANAKDKRRASRRIKTVSILFVSINGFDQLYKMEDQVYLVDQLDELIMDLEDIAFEYNVVRLKSYGDNMIFAAGLQGENRTNPIDMIRVAIEMQAAAAAKKTPDGRQFWNLKIGIHTGPVVATPGNNNSTDYNFSGDSINFACRVGEAAPLNSFIVTGMTSELIKEFYKIRELGSLPVKYKGSLNIYGVDGLLPELMDLSSSLLPNHNFRVKYLTLKFMDIQEELLDYLEQKLPRNLYYHNIKHTIDVTTEVELIGWAEGVSDEEILLLKLAALFHDAGHTISYKDHEYYSTVMAREKLAAYDFTEEQIDTVCRLIMATKMPPNPQDILEQIMCDSDLDYLGRTDFIPVSNSLYMELQERNMIGTWQEWNELQLRFITNHQYYTNTAIQLREVNKQQQIERLEQLIKESVPQF